MKTPKQRVAAHLKNLGYDVEPEDIRHVHGGKYKALSQLPPTKVGGL